MMSSFFITFFRRTPGNPPVAPFPTARRWGRGSAAVLLAVVAAGSLSLNASEAAEAEEAPPRKIDVGALPATVVDDVVVPVPTEVFGVLDKLGAPNWHAVLRKVDEPTLGERPQVAMLLGSVIAEGFIAVEAQDAEEIKAIGRQVLTLAKSIGVDKAVISRTSSIIEAADKRDWTKIRTEFDGALFDVKQAMIELKDEQLAQLVSLGGWLRGTEAVTAVVQKNYTKDGAELLHQPALLDHFQRQLDRMDPRMKRNPLVKKVRKRLPEIRPLIEKPDSVSSERVDQIHSITAELVKAITSKDS